MSKIMHARLRLAIAALISVAMLLVLANSPLQNTAIALLVAMGQDFFGFGYHHSVMCVVD